MHARLTQLVSIELWWYRWWWWCSLVVVVVIMFVVSLAYVFSVCWYTGNTCIAVTIGHCGGARQRQHADSEIIMESFLKKRARKKGALDLLPGWKVGWHSGPAALSVSLIPSGGCSVEVGWWLRVCSLPSERPRVHARTAGSSLIRSCLCAV
jgi:hypothetical protein